MKTAPRTICTVLLAFVVAAPTLAQQQTETFDRTVPLAPGGMVRLKTFSGRVRNELSEASGPGDAADTVQVRARTYLGDIVVRRT